MAWFTASITELRHDQIFILPVIMTAKLDIFFKSAQIIAKNKRKITFLCYS